MVYTHDCVLHLSYDSLFSNSPYTVLGESYSAGRLYDKISEEASGKVRFILDKGVICELIE
jgi:hypothetical protein